jgi:hypothetical protein
VARPAVEGVARGGARGGQGGCGGVGGEGEAVRGVVLLREGPRLGEADDQRAVRGLHSPTLRRTSPTVSEPTSAIIAHNMDAPLATKPPMIHWNRNGRNRLAST